MITEHDRLLAREVIERACEIRATGFYGDKDLDECRDIVIDARWPIRGRGGVASSYARTQRAVRAAIAEFYSHSPGDDEA
jgi:hypothetical protein